MRGLVLAGCLAFTVACGGDPGGTGGGAGGSAGGGTGGSAGGGAGGGSGGATGGGTGGGATGGGTGGGATGGGTGGGATGGGTGGGATGGGTGGGSTGGGTGGGATGGGTAAPFDAGATQVNYRFSSQIGDIVPAPGLAISGSRVVIASGTDIFEFHGVADGGFTRSRITDGGLGDVTRVVIDPMGRAHVVLRHDAANGLQLLHVYEQNDAGFATERIEDGGRVGNPAYDLRMAADGTLHVAYVLTNLVPLDGGSKSDYAIHHAQLTPTGWQYALVKRAFNATNIAQYELGYRLALALDPSGEPMILFQDEAIGNGQDGGGNASTLATRTGGVGGTWNLEQVGPRASQGFHQLIIDSNPVASAPLKAAAVQVPVQPNLTASFYGKGASGWQDLGYDAGYPQYLYAPALRFSSSGNGWLYGVMGGTPFQSQIAGFRLNLGLASAPVLIASGTGMSFTPRTNSSLQQPVVFVPGSDVPHLVLMEGDGNLNYRWSYTTRN